MQNHTEVDEHTRATEALYCLTPDTDRDSWVKLLMAYKDATGDAGQADAMNWSASASNYDEKNFIQTWRTLSPGRITAATLYYLAKEQGWQGAPCRIDPATQAEQALARQQQQARQDRADAEKHRKAASAAAKQFDKAAPVHPKALHPYLTAKNINFTSAAGLRIDSGGRLLIPYRDIDGVIAGVQTIDAAGEKRYTRGSRKKDNSYLIGTIDAAKPIGIAEGFATAASVHQLSGHCCAVAFDSGNVPRVAAAYRSKHPDAEIIVYADNDRAGHKAAAAAASELGCIVVCPSATGVTDPTTGEPVNDWNDYHRAADPATNPDVYIAEPAPEPVASVPDTKQLCGAAYRTLDSVEMKPIEWIWPQHVAAKINLIAGPAGVGKSQLSLMMASTVTTGGRWPDGSTAPLGSVILVGGEDDAADTIKPRMLAAGADVSRVAILDSVTDTDYNGVPKLRGWTIEDTEALEDIIRHQGDTRMIIIDPITAYIPNHDGHSTSDIRTAMMPLQELAERHSVAVVLITHLNKSNSSDAQVRVTGSGAWVAVARAAFMVGRDPKDEQVRCMLPIKNNIGNDDTGYRYKIESADVDGLATSRAVWDGESDIDASELLEPKQKNRSTLRDDCKQDIITILQRYPGGMQSTELQSTLASKSYKPKTVRRAMDDMNLRRWQQDSAWWVDLPEICK